MHCGMSLLGGTLLAQAGSPKLGASGGLVTGCGMLPWYVGLPGSPRSSLGS
jgi:hypothetical protein